jgi:tetrahydromethanopterin S-methyltransferase subunit G
MKRLLLTGWMILALASAALPQEAGTPQDLPQGLKNYLAELDRWSAAAKIIKDQPEQAAAYRKALPRAWPVSVRGQQFEVPTDWLAKDLDSIHTKPATAAPVCGEIQQELDQMRSAAEAFEQEAGPNPVQARTRLTAVLNRAEFREVHKRGWLDEIRERISVWFANLYERLFGGLGSHPEIGRVVLWGLLILLVSLFLVLLAQRFFRHRPDVSLDLKGNVLATRGWRDWARDALATAGRGNYREAIHFGYWAGIYRLEELGVWQAHRARTHREYLRLLDVGDGRRTPLAALTSRFELVWYGGYPARAEDFEFVVKQLEGLGCNIGLRPATGIS